MPTDISKYFVNFIFARIIDEVVGAGILDFLTGESFLEGGEAGPGVVLRGTFGGDAPEIKGFEILGFSIENKLGGEDAGGVKFAALVALGTLEIITGVLVVKY